MLPMKRVQIIATALVVLSSLIFQNQRTFAQQDASPAKSKSEFRTGQLVKIENVTDLMNQSQKAAYLLTIQDGSVQYFGYYKLTYFNRDRSKDLSAGKDIEYRIEGHNLFVRTSKGEEIKAHLCQKWNNCAKCGGATFCGAG
jgi:hypothetical protein